MSSDGSTAPIWNPPPASPKPLPEAVPGAQAKVVGERIAYLRALKFTFSHPEWLKNLAMFGVCLLIPVLNTIVEFGYSYEITELQHRRPGTVYPSFDFNRFAAYVTRGVWPFLVFFVMQTIVMVVYQVTFQFTLFGTMIAIESKSDVGTIVAAVVVPVVVIGFFTFVMAVAVVTRPILLRAGLCQDFAQTVKFPWFGDFLKKMWLETLLLNLFTVLLMLVLMPVGFLACCIGSVFMAGFVAITGAHLDWQLYELYLSRGGEPIPLKPLPADVPPVAIAPTPQA